MEMRPTDQSDVKIRDFALVLGKRWRLIALVTTVCIMVTGVVVLFQTPLYQSKAMIQVESEQPRSMLASESPNGDERLNTEQVPSEMEIIRSRLVLEPVVRELGFDATVRNPLPGVRLYLKDFKAAGYEPDTREEFRLVFRTAQSYEAYNEDNTKIGSGEVGKPFSGGGVQWVVEVKGVKAGDEIEFLKIPFDEAVIELQELLQIEEVGQGTNLLSVAIDLPSALQAQEAIRRLTQTYLAQNVERKSLEASQTLAFLEDQLLVVQGNMEKSEKDLNEVKSARGVFILSDDAKRIIDHISKLEVSKVEAELRQSQINQISAALRGGKSDSFLLGETSISDTLISSLSTELARLLIERRGLRQNATEKHPGVMALDGKIQELKGKIEAAVNNAKGSLGSQVATTNRLIEKYENQLKALPNAEREMAALARKSAVNGDLYSFLLKKHEDARISMAGIVGNIRIVENGALPIKPISPNKPRALALALFAGLLLGAGLAFFVEYLDDSIHEAEEIDARFGLGVFGEIPVFPARLKIGGNTSESNFLAHRADPRSSVHEAFRALATNIRFAGTHSGIKRIACTSSEPGEGKTTVIVNLALTLAERGSRVLLIDCDLRRPRIHLLFNLSQQPGLTNAVLGEVPWQDTVMRSGVERLGVIVAGALPPNQAELLDSDGLTRLLDEAGKQYDYVLIDLPPAIAFTDAAIVSTRVDAVFMIAAANQTRSAAFRRSIEVLRNVRAPVSGAIFTRSKNSPGSEEYYRAHEEVGVPFTFRAYGQWIRNLLLRA